jgi:hypothetical protein
MAAVRRAVTVGPSSSTSLRPVAVSNTMTSPFRQTYANLLIPEQIRR